MKIYIKSFNRPFYLDRCLRSVGFWVRGCDEVVVLDDGTLERYMPALRARHPHVRWEKSNADDSKYELVRRGGWSEIRARYEDAAGFWTRVLRRDAPREFVMLEDDTWFVDLVDLREVRDAMRIEDIPLVKLWWGPDSMHPPSDDAGGLPASFPAGLRRFRPTLRTGDDLWKVWIQCMAAYRLDYWMTAYEGIRDGVNDEPHQLRRIADEIARRGISTWGRSGRRVVYQGWAAPGRSDPKYASLGLAQHLLLDRLNEAWLSDELDSAEGMPFDFSADCLAGLFEGHLPPEQIAAWAAWRRGDLGGGYENWYNE